MEKLTKEQIDLVLLAHDDAWRAEYSMCCGDDLGPADDDLIVAAIEARERGEYMYEAKYTNIGVNDRGAVVWKHIPKFKKIEPDDDRE